MDGSCVPIENNLKLFLVRDIFAVLKSRNNECLSRGTVTTARGPDNINGQYPTAIRVAWAMSMLFPGNNIFVKRRLMISSSRVIIEFRFYRLFLTTCLRVRRIVTVRDLLTC